MGLDVYDNMTHRRFFRILKMQETRMEERKKALDDMRKKQDADTKRLSKKL